MTKEMTKLIVACDVLEIPHKVEPDNFGGVMVILLNEKGERIGDAICHNGSYGHEMGLLEVMGKGCEDDVIGWLNACDVIAMWAVKEGD